jgi:hypothetical protein
LDQASGREATPDSSESSRIDPLAFARRLRKHSSEFNNWKEVIFIRVQQLEGGDPMSSETLEMAVDNGRGDCR